MLVGSRFQSCTGSDSHIESRTSCASWSTKVYMDRHPTTCPDDVFEFATFLAVHISGRLQLDSSWCQLQTKKRLETKGLVLWPCFMEQSPLTSAE